MSSKLNNNKKVGWSIVKKISQLFYYTFLCSMYENISKKYLFDLKCRSLAESM